MKFYIPLFLTISVFVMLLSCEKEIIENQEKNADLKTQIDVSAKQQTSNACFDTTTKGIYHGVVAH